MPGFDVHLMASRNQKIGNADIIDPKTRSGIIPEIFCASFFYDEGMWVFKKIRMFGRLGKCPYKSIIAKCVIFEHFFINGTNTVATAFSVIGFEHYHFVLRHKKDTVYFKFNPVFEPG